LPAAQPEQKDIEMSFDLNGRVAMVTGGGRGLGRAFARALAAAGAVVVVTGRSADEIEETARLIEATSGRALPIRFDVAAPARSSIPGKWTPTHGGGR
jgi:NAD(P)-dependent dehydrogenase (short-subunit alcohol dehydrogenase family)